MIDLHCHTNVSDGFFSPAQLIELALKNELQYIAITDHDSVNGIEEAQKAALNSPLQVIPGIEISCHYPGIKTEIHMVGLFIDINHKPLQEILLKLKKFRYQRNKKMLEKLIAIGIDITINELCEQNQQFDETRLLQSVGKPNFAKIMLNKGYGKNQLQILKKYLDDEKGLARVKKETITAREAVSAIKNAHGLSILAHPHIISKELAGDQEFNHFIIQLKSLGLDAIEVYYNQYKKRRIKKLKRLAKQNKLLISGGSDYHNENFRNARLGYYGMKKTIPPELILPMQEHLKNNP